MTSELDLAVLTNNGTIHNLSGKERGEQARAALKLDHLDESKDDVVVKIPDYVYALSPSFFLGMFSNTLRKYGGKDGFFLKYKFEATPDILRQVNRGISRYMSSTEPFG